MKTLQEYFRSGLISFYGYSYSKLPSEIDLKQNNNISIFFKKKTQKNRLSKKLKNYFNSYLGNTGVTYGSKDIVFLDQNAVKSMCIGYPSNSKYVLISLRYLHNYLFIILGLIRRILINQITFKGIYWLRIGSKKVPWILIKNNEVITNSFDFSDNIGIKGLLSFLKKEKINYIVPRFYENLPNLLSHDSDLDLLVANEDVKKVNKFIMDNPGKIRIDIYTDTGLDYYGMPYYPPNKATKAIKDSVEGPAGALIPNKSDYLFLIIYHLLYHKGFNSRVSSYYLNQEEESKDNKYMKVINRLQRDLKIEVGKTMEEMDSFMDENGWRPAIDTLTKISQWNEWVLKFHVKKDKSNIPLYAFIIKDCFLGNKFEKKLFNECALNKLKILDSRILLGDVRLKAIENIRGGVWNDSLEKNSEVSKYYPKKIILLWDQYGVRAGGISKVKDKIRKKIDIKGPSAIHSSDNFQESLDYIKICMPDKYDFYKDEIKIKKLFSKYNIRNYKLKSFLPTLRSYIRLSLIKILSH